MFLFDSVTNKHKCFLDWIQDIVVYDKPCFIMPTWSNITCTSVKHCVQCIVCHAASFIGNWTILIM